MRWAGLALLATCAGIATAHPSAACAEETPYIAPYDAIWRAAADPKSGVTGTFKLTIKAYGVQSGIVYLNSEDDYRDQRNVSLDILPVSQAGMANKFGNPSSMIGKTFVVTGTAKRMKIWFFANGRATQKYYYQTHIAILSAEQVTAVDQ